MEKTLRIAAVSILAGAALWVASSSEIYFIRYATNVTGVSPREETDAALLLYLILVGPIIEEAIFRYGLIRVAMGRWSPRISIPISTAIFLAAHYDAFSTDLPRMLALLTLVTAGAGYGYLYVKAKTLLAPILAHGVYNAAIYYLHGSVVLFESIPEPAKPVLALAVFGSACWCFLTACNAVSAPTMQLDAKTA